MIQFLAGLILIVIIAIVAVYGFGASIGYVVFLKMLAKGGGGASATTSGTVAATGWSITNSSNMPAQMTPVADGTYFFDFPNQNGVHYVVERAPSLQLGQLVTLSFNVSGGGTVLPVQGATAQVSLFMQRRGDNLTGSGAYQQYRYWHQPAAPLVSGDGTISCTLTPDQWTDVFGTPGTDFPNQFADCVANAEMIGMTFGDPGAGAAGHGCYVANGQARFTLKSFTIV